VVRIASHVYDAGANTNRFSWTSAVGTAPTTSATYHIRTIIDGLSITDVDIRNCPTSVVRVFGNFRSPAITNITDNSDAVTSNPTIKLIADASNYCRNAEIRDWTARNKLGPDIDAANTGTRINGDFVDRSTAVEYIASGTINNDEVFRAGALQYIGETSATDIADMDAVVPFGDVTLGHFGTRGDGSEVAGDMTAETAAINAATAWAKAVPGRTLMGNVGSTYRINGSVLVGQAVIDLCGASIIGDGDFTIINADAEKYDDQDLSANYTTGEMFIAVAALAVAPKAGDAIKIVARSAIDPGNRDQGTGTNTYAIAEWCVVGRGSTITRIELSQPLRFTKEADDTEAYTTANNAKVYVLSNDERFEVKNGQVYHAVGTAGSAFTVTGFKEPQIKVDIPYANKNGVSIAGCYRPKVRGQIATGEYGVTNAGCYQADVNCDFFAGTADARHGYTTNAYTTGTTFSTLMGLGRTQGSRVRGTAEGFAVVAGFDTHHCGNDETFIGTVVQGGDATAYAARGRNIVFDRPQALGGTGGGFHAFTEFDGADGANWVAGNSASDHTSSTLRDAFFQRDRAPFRAKESTVSLCGNGYFKTNDHMSIFADGAQVSITGLQRFIAGAGSGQDDTGVFEIRNTHVDSALPPSRTVIEAGALVDVDASAADATGISLFNLQANSTLIIRGTLRAKMPSGSGFLTGGGTVRCEGDGKIILEVDGAADNSIITDVSQLRGLRLETVDGSAWWDDVSGKMATTFVDGNVGVQHVGTGATVDDVYVPEGQYGWDGMDAAGSGTIRYDITGNKTGTAGDYTLQVNSRGGNFVANLVVPSAHVTWGLEAIMTVTSTGNQRYEFILTSSDGTNTRVIRDSKNETQSPFPTSEAFSIGVNSAVGDQVNARTCRVEATAGGVL